jgi:hypothetical protein
LRVQDEIAETVDVCLAVVGLRVSAIIEQTFYALQYAVAVENEYVCYSQNICNEQQ